MALYAVFIFLRVFSLSLQLWNSYICSFTWKWVRMSLQWEWVKHLNHHCELDPPEISMSWTTIISIISLIISKTTNEPWAWAWAWSPWQLWLQLQSNSEPDVADRPDTSNRCTSNKHQDVMNSHTWQECLSARPRRRGWRRAECSQCGEQRSESWPVGAGNPLCCAPATRYDDNNMTTATTAK